MKGGIGKSASAMTFAHILSKKGNVLIIDLDPQNAATSHYFDDADFLMDNHIGLVFTGQKSVHDLIFEVDNNIDMIPADLDMDGLNQDLLHYPDHMFMVVDIVETLRERYDYIIIDTHPGKSLLTKMGLMAADCCILPTQPNKWSVRGSNIIINVIEENENLRKRIGKSQPEIKILPTLVVMRQQVHKVWLKILKDHFSEYLTQNYINRIADIEKVYAGFRVQLPEGHKAWKEYENVIKEVIGNGIRSK